MFGRYWSPHSAWLEPFWRLQQEMDEELGEGLSSSGGIRSLPRGSFPAVNVIQTPEALQVYVFAPGIDASKLEVSIQQGLLTISGSREIEPREAARYYRQERFTGEFTRAVSLGEEVDPEQVDARYRDGILQISLKRREAAKARQIEIH
ncbi:MAG: Hsp20/alpha crystallin family protein [Gammaproteobacteria bacterium]|nr:Hsp20/alpha crystallin family protein [Gammaproteobacteria bacterium]MBV9621907.1 Hsp20/alpha crystallin family protein [Gammaproteobacteria bacterium]